MIGSGYVGLVVGACLAESGNHVICIDSDEEKIAKLNKGHVPIYEPGLSNLVKQNGREDRLKFTTNLTEGVQASLLIFVAVGTPPNEDGSGDLSAVFAVAKDVAKAMNDYKVVITKSTVPIGTTRKVKEVISQLTNEDFDVVSNPEFLKEGNALNDFMRPDRVVIGTDSVKAVEIMKELYAPFVRTESPIIVMDLESAEMTKYAANTLLATKISFMNEMANLCEQVGADVENVRKGIGADKRIGYQFLFPGVGYGGSCFPKDVKALINTAKESNCELKIAEAADHTNFDQRERFFQKIYKHFNEDVSGKRIAVWGLSFKPATDDMREAPSITIISRLLEHDAMVQVHDPKANEVAKSIFGDRISYSEDSYDSLDEAEALILVTEWPEFRSPDFERMKSLMKTPVIFDGRNIYNPAKLRKMGFTYYGIGRR